MLPCLRHFRDTFCEHWTTGIYFHGFQTFGLQKHNKDSRVPTPVDFFGVGVGCWDKAICLHP
jgi:hypothetical protein